MNHKNKLKIARKLQTKDELKEKGTGVFESVGWETRKAQIVERIKKHQLSSKVR